MGLLSHLGWKVDTIKINKKTAAKYKTSRCTTGRPNKHNKALIEINILRPNVNNKVIIDSTHNCFHPVPISDEVDQTLLLSDVQLANFVMNITFRLILAH